VSIPPIRLLKQPGHCGESNGDHASTGE